MSSKVIFFKLQSLSISHLSLSHDFKGIPCQDRIQAKNKAIIFTLVQNPQTHQKATDNQCTRHLVRNMSYRVVLMKVRISKNLQPNKCIHHNA